MTDALENIDNRPTLRFERRYDHGVERVWRAITDPDELRFELRPDGEGCVLVFSHAFDDRNKAARDAAGWDRCFVRLDALLRGEPMSAKDSLEGWSEVHERYAAEFGVDPALGRQALAEHDSQR